MTPPLTRRSALLGTLALALLACSPPPVELRAIDGDSLVRTSDGARIRVAGLDAPELRSRCPEEAQLAERAKARLGELVSGGAVLEERGLDKYGRRLAVVRVGGKDVAAVLIGEGLARAYHGRGTRQGWC